ncbi:MAG: hypothetical protein K5644_03470, partial [Lachnospiraceae bacterium]|nr:hypothetical protein [Lachnospiraceae bacterium]
AGGSEVTAYGGFYGAGIGTGERGTLRNISISDSKVNSTGGDGAAGIGGGTNSKVSDANVSISGSSEVISLGGVGGAGIGTGVIFNKQNPGDTDVFGQVCISDNSTVHADGGPGAAGIGGGSGENNYLAEELLWDSGKSRSAGTVGTFTMNRTDSGDPLVIAASGYNYIDELYSNVEYKTAPVDVGQGGSFIENDSPQSTTMQINGGTLLSLGSDKYSKWNESFRSSLNGNALAPDKSSKHLDNNEDDRNDVYRVSLRVPDIETYTRINVSVTGDGSTDKEGDAYYDNTPLYTDGEGMVYLWLGEGATDATNAEVTADGRTYHYFGTCTNDNNGRLNMIAEVVLEDNFDKVYDGELIEEPPLKVCSGDGKVSYTYYKYKWEEGTSTEADLTEDLIIPRREVKDAGDYTVRVDMSAGEFCGAAYDIGGFAITPAETKISAIIGHKSTKGIELTAFVNGLVENDQDYGTVYFVIRQGSGIVETSKDVDVNSNGRADITIDGSAIPAGTYTIYAYFRCNPDKKNYYNSQDSKDYDFSKLTAQIEMDPIEVTYNDDDIYVPGSEYKPTVTVIGGSSEDVENVTSALQYSMINPANDIAVYSGGKITTLNAGKTYMLIKYTGSERINPAATIVSVIVKRKPVTAIPLVSVLERDDTWTNYEHEAMTTYKRTENEKYLRYKVMYTDDNLELAGLNLTEVVPLGSRVFSSYEDYDVQLIRKKLTRNYAVTLGEPAKVYVGKAARDVLVKCADVTFGELPRPSTYCDIPFIQRELTYVYEGTTNSGRSIARTFIPPLQAGEYTVTAVLSERYNYTYANSEPYSFTIKRADLEPVVHIEDYTYGDATNIFVTGNKGTGEVTYTYYKDYECRIPTSALDGADYRGGEPKNVGKYFAVAHIDETNNFNEAYSLPAEFKILRKSVEVKADDKVKIVNHNDPEFTATVTGLINNDTIDYTLSRNPGEAIGDYTITPSGEAEQGNYDITFTSGKFIISQGYTLYFDLDGGTIDGQSGSIEYIGLVDGDVITIPGPPEKAGYEFLYWEGSRYYPGDQYVVHGQHNFKAVWKEAYGSGSSKYGKGSRLLTGDNAMSIYSLAAILILAIIVVSVSVVQARKKQS